MKSIDDDAHAALYHKHALCGCVLAIVYRQGKNLITPQLHLLRDILFCKRPSTDSSTQVSVTKTTNLNIRALEKCCCGVQELCTWLDNKVSFNGIGIIQRGP